MSCCSVIHSLGSGIRSMFSPTPCHTCPEPVTVVTVSSGSLFLMESGHLALMESGHAISVE